MDASKNSPLIIQPLGDISKDDQEKQQKYEFFKQKNKTIIELWLASHPPHIYPPIYYDEKLKSFRWLSRQERRVGKRDRLVK
jgi:hypothetical protein